MRNVERVENELAVAIEHLRDQGWDWQMIADAAAMDVATVRERSGGNSPR